MLAFGPITRKGNSDSDADADADAALRKNKSGPCPTKLAHTCVIN